MTALLTIVGARPQFVKASAVSRAIVSTGTIRETVVHTGQHFDDEMSAFFFRELELVSPKYNLGVAGGDHGDMTGRMLQALEPVIRHEQPDVVLVYGDTNTTLAGALAAAKLGAPVVHVEAGLRSFNQGMPEEINRVVTDHVSALLCCPTRTAIENLKREGFEHVLADGRLADAREWTQQGNRPCVVNVGDVMLDVLQHYRQVAVVRSTILDRLGLGRRQYGVATVHRASNTVDNATIASLVNALSDAARVMPIVFPMHPRTRQMLASCGALEAVTASTRLIITEPLSYFDFLQLQCYARAIITDSGGVQKEAFFLGVPCLTLRSETEWPETLEGGWNQLIGSGADLPGLLELAWPARPPQTRAFGDGNAGQRIAALIAAVFGSRA